jgi:hypothetical protein
MPPFFVDHAVMIAGLKPRVRARLLASPIHRKIKVGSECCPPKASTLPLICGTSAGSASSSKKSLSSFGKQGNLV